MKTCGSVMKKFLKLTILSVKNLSLNQRLRMLSSKWKKTKLLALTRYMLIFTSTVGKLSRRM
jgi:hypothetical protein